MNIDNDYDNDGNNIVPCPICMSNYCPSKENAKCPGEDMFALEGEIRMLLGEYEETGDNSRIANVLETVERLLTSRDTYWKERHAKEVNRILNLHSKPIAEGGLDYVKAFEEMEKYEHKLFKSLNI